MRTMAVLADFVSIFASQIPGQMYAFEYTPDKKMPNKNTWREVDIKALTYELNPPSKRSEIQGHSGY